HTEADPVAILTQLLVACGAAVGRGAFFQVEATRHHPNEFMLLVGDSSKARKGSSWDHVRRLLATVDPSIEPRILTGLSSGEGLIWAPRGPDPARAGEPSPPRAARGLRTVAPASCGTCARAGQRPRPARDRRPRVLASRLPPARPSPPRDHRPDHRPRRSARDPPRAH